MRYLTGIARTCTVTAAAALVALGCSGTASADALPPVQPVWPFGPASEVGRAIGDTMNCQIHYRVWAETDPAGRPRHTRVNVQAIGMDALPGFPQDATCNQWIVLTVTGGDGDRLGPIPMFQQHFYVRASQEGGTADSMDIDLTSVNAAPGRVVLATGAMSRPSGYIPFWNWGPEKNLANQYWVQ